MKPLELINKKIGKLLVVKRLPNNKSGQAMWECLCECGNKRITSSSHIKRLNDCGCARIAQRGYCHKSHGLSKKIPEYAAWENMKRRCYYKKGNRFEFYGKRGIVVCDRWKNSFENFYFDMGNRPSKEHSLERIDVNKNYSPENCKWATRKEQTRNKTNNVHITINGETKCLIDWLKHYNIASSIVYRRRKKGWSLDEKLFIKTRVVSKNKK